MSELEHGPWTLVEVGDEELPLRWALGYNNLFMCFEIATLAHQGEPFSDPDDTEATGALKWDGCINWETSPDCMYHFCEPGDLDRLQRALRRVWTLGKVAMGDRYEGAE